MSIVLDRRLRADKVDATMKELRDLVEEARRRNTKRRLIALSIGGVLAGAALTAAFTIDFDDGTVNCCLPIGAIFLSALIFAALDQGKRIERKAAKVEFVGKVLDGVVPDMHPRTRIKLNLDLRPYDVRPKVTWRGASIYGNPKVRYADRWLHLGVVLADHTRVELKQRIGIKTKKGSIMSERRRFFLIVRPSARYDPRTIARDAEGLRKRLKEAVTGLFRNAPEEGHVHVDSTGSELRIGVRQEDAPIIAEEILGLIGVVVKFLSRHVRRRAA